MAFHQSNTAEVKRIRYIHNVFLGLKKTLPPFVELPLALYYDLITLHISSPETPFCFSTIKASLFLLTVDTYILEGQSFPLQIVETATRHYSSLLYKWLRFLLRFPPQNIQETASFARMQCCS